MKKKLLFSLMSICLFFTPMLNATPFMIDTTTTVIQGCTNPQAKNFDPAARKDNGTCVFGDSIKPPVNPPVIYGCMNPKAKNFNPAATQDNGSCVFDSTKVVYGCKDSTALNYNPQATKDNRNCIYKTILPGCTDTLAVNYNSKANVNDESCKYDVKIWGCTDKSALNYNPQANHNSGYCQYDTIVSGCTDKVAINYNPLANHDNKTCVYTSTVTLGCTDPFALNFNKYATKDNGSCTYEMVSDTIKGCLDRQASNFNPIATKTKGNCVYDTTNVYGCRSPRALNYDSLATHDDGSCVFAHPANVVLPVMNSEITAIADTLGKVLAASCNFDYSLAIDSVRIIGTKHLSNNIIEVDWAITQGTVITNIKTDFTVKKKGAVLLYLSLVCNQGVAITDSTSASHVSALLNTVKSKVSSISTDVVKGVTLSAFLSNSVVSDVATTTLSNSGVTLYPNPVKDQLNVSVTSASNKTLQLIVYSVDGRKLSTTIVTPTSGVNHYYISTSSLEAGLHFLTVNQDGKMLQTVKFAKY